ncbi:hypothetical protein D1007_28909 [Hordeum vulgare]|nr:hypothetical protein D1007_28909 [Hordeum vulgare]
MPPTNEADSVSLCLDPVKLLLRGRAAAVAAVDVGLPAEAVCHLNKVFDAHRGGVLTLLHHGVPREPRRDIPCVSEAGQRHHLLNRVLALEPAFISTLRAHQTARVCGRDPREPPLPGPPEAPLPHDALPRDAIGSEPAAAGQRPPE